MSHPVCICVCVCVCMHARAYVSAYILEEIYYLKKSSRNCKKSRETRNVIILYYDIKIFFAKLFRKLTLKFFIIKDFSYIFQSLLIYFILIFYLYLVIFIFIFLINQFL